MARINHLQLESLELRRIYNDMTMVFKIVHKFTDLNDSNLLIMCNTTHNTRGHAFKLKTRSFRLDIARNHFCNRVVPLWNSLPAHVVNKPSPKPASRKPWPAGQIWPADLIQLARVGMLSALILLSSVFRS